MHIYIYIYIYIHIWVACHALCPELALPWLAWLVSLGAWWGFLVHGISCSWKHYIVVPRKPHLASLGAW